MLDKLSAERARDVVMEALQSVQMDRRAIFVLSELDGHAMPEIAETLSIPLNTVYSRLRLARETFTAAARRILDDAEVPDE